MKKKVIAGLLSLSALLFAGTAAVAQDNQPAPPPCAGQNCPPREQPCAQGQPCAPGRPQLNPTCMALQGINITEEQRTRIQALATPQQNADSLRRVARQEYLNGIKQILTPDQYVQFLENSYLMGKGPKAPGMRQGRGNGNRPEGQRGERGQRGNRNGGHRNGNGNNNR